MIVLDASAALDLLLRRPLADQISARVFGPGEEAHAPHVIDLEVAHVLRRHVRAGLMTARRGREAVEDWIIFPVERHGHDLLLPRVWSLQDAISAYDASYIALAETLGASLLTTDARLARTRGHTVEIEVLS